MTIGAPGQMTGQMTSPNDVANDVFVITVT